MRASAPLTLVALLAALAGLSCVFEFRPTTPIVGTYEISPGCPMTIDETAAAASCAGGEEVQVSIDDEEVTFQQVVVIETEKNTECWVERVCTRTYSGTATRGSTEGTPYDGLFAKLAGTWHGSLTMRVSCSKQKAVTNPPAWCAGATGDLTYTFDATVGAHEAKVTWSASNNASGEFQALETKGGVRVADTFYPRLATQPDGGRPPGSG